MQIQGSQTLKPWSCPKCKRDNPYFLRECKCGYNLMIVHNNPDSAVTQDSSQRGQLIAEQLERDQPIETRKQLCLLRQFRRMYNIYVPEKYPDLTLRNGCGIKLLKYGRKGIHRKCWV